MAEATTSQTAGPLQFFEPAAAGYCDPVTGLCMLPAVPELPGDPAATTLPDQTEDAAPESRPRACLDSLT